MKVQQTQFALRKLDLVVDEFWAEISDSIQTIEVRSLHKSFRCGIKTRPRWFLRMISTLLRSANRLRSLQARFCC